jgi:hypothetical protein
MATIWDVAQAANTKAAWHEREARRPPWLLWKQYHLGKAVQFRGEDYLARRVYEALAGGGLPECKIEQWVQRQRFRMLDGQSALFRMNCARGVYGDSLLTKPLFLIDLSPTINVHDSYMGTDKLGHLFQQGYEYYMEYRREELRGGGERRALGRAVRLGVDQERGIFGEGLIGVFSNADLAANYAGLKFYLNLTRPVSVGGRSLPPLLVRRYDGLWALNGERAAADFLRPFVSDHFNEALNPSRFCDQMRPTVRANLRRRVDRLLAFYRTTAEQARAKVDQLWTWHGEDYGHCGLDRVVTIADNCFDETASTDPRAAAAPMPAR